MQSTSWEMLDWKKHKLESRLPGEISITSDRWHHPYGRKWRGTKKPLNESESGEWKSWLKAQHSENEDHGIWPITSWEIDGKTVKTMSDFIFWGSKITANGDCSHEIKRHLLLGRKAMIRHYFAEKSPPNQRYSFSSSHVWMWELDCEESWSLKN